MPPRNTLRALPSIDALLRAADATNLRGRTSRARLTTLARTVSEEMRAELRERAIESSASNGGHSRESLLADALSRLARAVEQDDAMGLRRVINATGVVLHTRIRSRDGCARSSRRAS
jgi:hypothetical protein